jgi:uncharacterized protein (DUF362 family)
MHDVLIGAVESYENQDAIRNFINTTFRADKALDEIFGDSGKHRLVVVKPNWVQESHEYKKEVWEPVITNPNVIICLLECLAERFVGEATICVCDAPHTYADFPAILGRGEFGKRFEKMARESNNIKFELLDLRREVCIRKEEVVVERRQNPEDPRGYVKVDLGEDSLFYQHAGEGKYYGADYDSAVVNSHHHGKIQAYLIARTPIDCDLFINVPKMKTHKKTGITCCLKSLVGINGDKNWLPHHTQGSPDSHGDEFPRLSFKNRVESGAKLVGMKLALNVPFLGTLIYRKMRNAGKQLLGDSETVIRNGNWSGNDTCWRMALDLNRALFYANSDGTWRDRFQPKRYLAIVDGIIAGQGNGPLCPDPVQSNLLVSGTNPAEVDAVIAKLMGFDPQKIPIIKHAFDPHRWPITTREMEEIRVHVEGAGRELGLAEIAPAVEGGFIPHFGWVDK